MDVCTRAVSPDPLALFITQPVLDNSTATYSDELHTFYA